MTCISCHNEHNEKFCPHCGEKATVPKITLASILKHGFTSITNMDKGFLYNVKNLFIRPKAVVLDYLRGKRKDIFNPVSYLIITITIYLIGESLLPASTKGDAINNEEYRVGYAAGKFVKNYFKYFWILSVFWLSTSTKMIFGRYNYAEHLAINSFVIGQATLVGLLGFMVFRIPLLFHPVIHITIIWLTYRIFKSQENSFTVFSLSVAATLLFFIQLIVLVILIGLIMR